MKIKNRKKVIINCDGWKKKLLFVAVLIVCIRIIYILIDEEVDKTYYISTPINISSAEEIPCVNICQKFKSDQERLHSLEFILSGIADDKIGAITLKIFRDDELLYQTNISLTNIDNYEWKRVYVNLPLYSNEEYIILLDATQECTQIPNILLAEGSREVIKDNETEIYKQAAIQYGYLQKLTGVDKAIFSSIWLIGLIILMLLLNKIERVRKCIDSLFQYTYLIIRKDVCLVIGEVLLCTIILNSSGIQFQESTKVIFYALSLLSAFGYEERKKSVGAFIDKSWKKYMLFALYIYSAFALVGQRIFIVPFERSITLAEFFVFCITVLWFVPIIIFSIHLFGILELYIFNKSESKESVDIKFFSLIIICLLLPAVYNLYANNPGISSNDTVACMITNAKNLFGMRDWHPAFYCMILRLIQNVWDSTYAVIIVQYFFWVYVMLEFLLYLQKKGIKKNIILIITLFFGANAGNFLHLNTIWKDIPYALSLLWVLIILAKLSIDYDEYIEKKYIYFELVIALIGIYFFRKNGIIPFIIIAVMMCITLKNNIKIWGSLILTIALILFIKFPLYSYFEVEDTGRYGMYIGLSQDILGVY